MQYWFNIRTGQVEADDVKSREDELMGPYATQEAAASAYALARKRTEEWDKDDEEWDGT